MQKINQILILTIITFLTMPVCKEKDHKHEQSKHQTLSSAPASSESVFLLESLWQTEENKRLKFVEFTGKRKQVIAMVYLNCENVCPRIVADMRYLRERLNKDAQASTDFTLITIDPKRDTIKKFFDYKKKLKLDGPRWRFLRGEEGDIREMAAVLGVKYKQLMDGNFGHSNMISILNNKGEIVYQQQGIREKIEKTLRAIQNIDS